MTHIAILLFFGIALVAGLYCFLLSIRVEFGRGPRLLHMESSAYHPALSSTGTAGMRNTSTRSHR